MDFFFGGFSTLQITILLFSAVLIGINKTGMPGLGLLPVVLLANTFEPGFATGLQLIMLALADIPAGIYYRKTVNWKVLGRLIPAALGGIAIGSFVLRYIPGGSLNVLIGSIILGLCVLTVVKELFWKDTSKIPTHWSFSAFFGLLAGFATQVANAAGPIMVIYLLSMRFEKKEYMGTAAWYFLLLNWTKVPIFVWEGRITETSVHSALITIPLLLVGAVLGIIVLKKLPQRLFERIVLVLSGLAAIKMLF
jgi:uncharacterized membrane protein YfcA